VLRYVAPSALIVLGLLAVVLAIPHRAPDPPKAPRYADSRASPQAGGPDRDDRTAEPVTGDAPWALSAVPECFRARIEYAGTMAFVRSHLPAGARPVSGRRRFADCVLEVRGATIELIRGENRLTVPPPARLYESPSGLALLQRAGSRERLRVYAIVPGARPSPSPSSAT
jgi:hypothetical protein